MGVSTGGKAANLNWMVRECLIEGTALEKGEEASFVDIWARAFLAVEPPTSKALDKNVSGKFE